MTGFSNGTLVSDTGVMQTQSLGDGQAVPAGSVSINGIAHTQTGERYVTTWPADNAVQYLNGAAVRNDGAQVVAESITPAVFINGIGRTARGETFVATAGTPFFMNGFGVTAAGALLVSNPGFTPLSLFTSGVAGAWYDPSDYSTLFQDSAGTTPVTAVEQPVGLMLDKSQGLVLGSEATSGAWLNGHTTTFDTFTSTGPSSFTATTTGAKAPRVAVLASLPAAGWYWIEFTATFTGGSFSTVGVSNTGSPYSAAVATTVLPATGVAFRTLIYTSAAREYLTVTFNATGASTLSVTGVSVKSYAGNHASQATAASRPVLRARYNLLTYSEQFDNAVWTKSGVTLTTNATTAPDGTTTADFIVPLALAVAHALNSNTIPTLAGVNTFSVYAKAGGYNYIQLLWGTGSDYANFNLTGAGSVSQNSGASPTIAAIGNGWYRCSITTAIGAGQNVWMMPIVTGTETRYPTFTGDGTSGVYVWGADLRTGSSAGTYQRIAAATDYATTGFLPYLALDGVDDFVASAAIDFSTTDKVTLCSGITKNSDALRGVFAHLGNSATATFRAEAPDASLNGFAFYTTGSAAIQGSQATSAAPATKVFTGIGDIAADINLLRLNGVQVASNTADQGTGNYSNAVLNVGRRGDGSLFFNGRVYQFVVCGKTLSASELASTEAYVNSKTGAY